MATLGSRIWRQRPSSVLPSTHGTLGSRIRWLCTWKKLAHAQSGPFVSAVRKGLRVTSRTRGSLLGSWPPTDRARRVEKGARPFRYTLPRAWGRSAWPSAFPLGAAAASAGWEGEMSWFNASQLSSFAKQALSQAQKSIDRVLDIQDEEPSAWAETIPYGEPGKGQGSGARGRAGVSPEAGRWSGSRGRRPRGGFREVTAPQPGLRRCFCLQGGLCSFPGLKSASRSSLPVALDADPAGLDSQGLDLLSCPQALPRRSSKHSLPETRIAAHFGRCSEPRSEVNQQGQKNSRSQWVSTSCLRAP